MRHCVLLILAAAILASPATACSCLYGGPCQDAKARVIFTGRVVDATRAGLGSTYTFEVTEVFRGMPARRVQVSAGNDGASCGYQFQIGEEYLVYANEDNGVLSTNLCNGNKVLQDAASDLRYLRRMGSRLASPPLPAYVSGFVTNREVELHPEEEPRWPVRGAEVVARTETGLTARATTGPAGEFELPDLPPGRYQITVNGPGRYESRQPTTLDLAAGSCEIIAFLNTARSILRGKLFESDGEPGEATDLRLVPLDAPVEPPRYGDNELEAYTEEDGTYRFKVPPGRYRLEILRPFEEGAVIPYPEMLVLEDPTRPGAPAPQERSITFRLPARPNR